MSGFEKYNDRLTKYGIGMVRLALLVAVTTFGSKSTLNATFLTFPTRYLTQMYIGVLGAAVNTSRLGFNTHIALLILAGCTMLYDMWTFDLTLGFYLLKTTIGDFLAGKVDSTEWKLVASAVAASVVAGCVWGIYSPVASGLISSEYARIVLVLSTIQFVCEYGDNHLEHLKFFRHRYSYEIFTALVVFALPLFGMLWTDAERRVIEFDMIICLWYRVGNFACLQIFKSAHYTSLKKAE
eukprot:m.345401 g.345401  ORF g.345401 m.345401 type:complete len:239 (+) comp16557_c0_seq8:219-935(+)